jgi:cellulose synthase/poly-beta-1,6-N-acetylglucosamine synthase-like glycosyltransferase
MIGLLLVVLLPFGAAVIFAVVLNGWRETVAREASAPPIEGTTKIPAPMVAMVVPARNAARTITPLLQDLYAQDYERERVTVIVVDDASEDATGDKVRAMMQRWPQLKLLRCDGEGKKAAITTGVDVTDAEWVLVTDADARCGPERLRLLVEHVQRAGSDLVLMPVATDGEGVLGRLQENEQAALMMCAAGETIQGRPMLANGANLAFRRSGFMEVRGYEGDRYASGDDIFLVQRMRNAGKPISYLLHAGAVVRVEAERTWIGFFRQRMRWSGKMRGVPWRHKWMPALGVLFPWLLFAITLGIDWPGMVGQHFFMNALLIAGAWVLWLAPVPALVRDGQRFLGQRYSLAGALLSYLAFTVYSPVIALLGMFVRTEWKGRRIR